MGKESENKKDWIVSVVKDLNGIIKDIDYDNCCDLVIKFFGLTSLLDDNRFMISKPPLKGVSFLGIKSRSRKRAETDCASFMICVGLAGRDLHSHNRTSPGEAVTKDNVYFGEIYGLPLITLAELEKITDDEYMQMKIHQQILLFVREFKGGFKLDWLR